MGKKQKDIIEEIEEVEEVEEEPKKGKKKESVEKRKREKKKDAIERWSGIIFLGLILLIGLLLWVGGEVGSEPKSVLSPIPRPSMAPKVILQ